MNEADTIGYAIVFILLVLFVSMMVFGLSQKAEANYLCKQKCFDDGGIAYEIPESGDWKVNDICICFYKDRMEAFRL